jgi:HAE1 family hydrophobic/amphiphilic exporter-1
MMTVLILIFGTLSFSRLGLDMLPEMNFPVISIITTYSGANSEEVEYTVTRILENALAGVKNMKSITSESQESFSLITMEFDWGIDLDASTQDIRDIVDRVIDYLPDSVGRPMVMKFDTSLMPVIMYGVTGMSNTNELLKVLNDDIANKLKRLDGVASITVFGGDKEEKQIIVDKNKLERYNVTTNDIQMAVFLNNQSGSGGHINHKQRDYFIRTIGEYRTIEEIENTPIRLNRDGSFIRIKDVAEVRDGFVENRYHIRTNQKPTVAFYVMKESGANSLNVMRDTQAELKRIQDSGQYDLSFEEIFNTGILIESTTADASQNIIFGSIFAIIVMYLFIRNWRSTLAISVAIPISIIATFIPLYLMKYSLNLMTLGGLALGAGMLIDNAVVVIENVYRHIEMGKDRFRSAIDGTSEVALAVSASTFTTIAVFLPMVFSTGMTAVLVRGLALTVSFSLLVSLAVSLTVVPTLASVFFTDKAGQNKKIPWFETVRKIYISILAWCLAHRGKTASFVLLSIIVAAFIFSSIGAEFMPDPDTPILLLNVKMPKGTVLEETDAFVRQIEQVFAQTEGVKTFLALVGAADEGGAQAGDNPSTSAEAMIFASLHDKDKRDISNKEIIENLRMQIPSIKNGEITFVTNAMAGSQKPPIEVKIFGSDLDELKRLATELTLIMQNEPDLRDIKNTMGEGSPEIHFQIDRDKAARYNLTSAAIAASIRTALQGSVIGVFRHRGEEINIRLRYPEDQRNTLEDVREIRINTPMGGSIPLNHILSEQLAEGHARISREGQTRKVTVSANIHGSDLAGATRKLQKSMESFSKSLPIGYYLEFGGSFQDMQEGFTTLALALLLSIVLVYIVMASQFEDLKQPFIVMFTMPLQIIGISLALFLTRNTLSVASFVGIIICSGIVTNNGIVLIDYVNQLRRKGMDKYEALIKAGNDRVRPVLITSVTTVIAMLPMAISQGQGSEMKSPMAITIIGGLLSATFFTLVVIPVIYSLFDRKKK